MKRIVLLIAIMMAVLPVLYAQTDTQEIKIIKYEMDNDSEDGGNLEDMVFLTTSAPSSVYFGIFVEDLNAEIAEKLEYPEDYGILVTRVVEESPADEIDMEAHDIIMEIDGQQVTDRATFDEIRSKLQPGDLIKIRIWREGEPMTLEMEMMQRPDESLIPTQMEENDKKLSPGYGGGGYVPMWFTPDLTDINGLMTNLGFDTLGEDGVFMSGGAGKGNVGNGFFIGGFGASAEIKRDAPDADPAFHNWMKYYLTFGGVTLDKRIPISKKLIGSLGLMMGGGSHSVELAHLAADYTWPVDFTGSNYNITMSREFITVHPKAELMYRLLSWLAIRAEVGYVWGYAPDKGWKVTGQDGNMYDISGSPDTTLQGLTFSIGPWFGF